MKFYDLLTDGYTRISQILERSLKGLTVDDLKWLPHPESNSIGWLTWHATRVQDSFIATLLGDEQLWIKDGWHTKFGRPPDAQDNGAGNTPQDVAAFKSPDAKTLLDYHRAVLERSIGFFPTLSTDDLDGVVENLPFQPPPTVGPTGSTFSRSRHLGPAREAMHRRQAPAPPRSAQARL